MTLDDLEASLCTLFLQLTKGQGRIYRLKVDWMWNWKSEIKPWRTYCAVLYVHYDPKNRAHILSPITFTNIDQHQCHLSELFVQHYLIIYHKNYSYNRVPAATIAMATSALSQTNACANSAHLPIVHVSPSSVCARSHLIWFLPTSGHLIATT